MKTGKSVRPKYYIISIFLIENGVLIQAEHPRASRPGQLEYKFEIPENQKSLDKICIDLVENLQINEKNDEIIVKLSNLPKLIE